MTCCIECTVVLSHVMYIYRHACAAGGRICLRRVFDRGCADKVLCKPCCVSMACVYVHAVKVFAGLWCGQCSWHASDLGLCCGCITCGCMHMVASLQLCRIKFAISSMCNTGTDIPPDLRCIDMTPTGENPATTAFPAAQRNAHMHIVEWQSLQR